METKSHYQKWLESYIVYVESNTGIEVSVVDWNNGSREVAIHFKDFGQMLTLNAEGARNMAFLLMECADFIEPPFVESAPPTTDESEFPSIFGSYNEDVNKDEDDD